MFAGSGNTCGISHTDKLQRSKGGRKEATTDRHFPLPGSSQGDAIPGIGAGEKPSAENILQKED